jgi:hypothetical protein
MEMLVRGVITKSILKTAIARLPTIQRQFKRSRDARLFAGCLWDGDAPEKNLIRAHKKTSIMVNGCLVHRKIIIAAAAPHHRSC